MPYSHDAFTKWNTDLVKLLQPKMVLDIGCGAGKYGKIVREVCPEARIVGYEIHPPYIEQFRLCEVYHEVRVRPAISLLDRPRERYDLVLMGDVIEHMTKSQGVDLLNFLIYRSGYISVVYPEAYVQDDWEGNPHEAHISTWSSHDFAGWETIHKTWEGMNLYLVKGYQPSRMAVTG